MGITYYLEASARRPEGEVEGEHDDEDGSPELILPWGRAGQGGAAAAGRSGLSMQCRLRGATYLHREREP